MKKIGMLVAVEIDAVLEDFGHLIEKINRNGFDIYHYQIDASEVYVIHSGAGQLSAAAATQLLISVYDVELVLNFGVVGGLTEEMALAKSCVIEKVVHYEYDTTAIDHCKVGQYVNLFEDEFIPITQSLVDKACEVYPELKRVSCASGDKFVDGKEKKTELHKQFNCDICEMEAAAIALTCFRSNVACLFIKTVSDAITGGAEDFMANVNATAKICLNIMKQIINEL
jgi:adenosylhomocysteine nucleosidase